TWALLPSGTTQTLNGVWGSGADVFAVGSGGTILHSSDGGATGSLQASGTTQTLNGVWASGPTDAAAVGPGGTFPLSVNAAATCALLPSGTTQTLNGVWGSGPNVFAVGTGGTIAIGTLTKASQTISFGPLAGKAYGDAPFTVSATASSGLPVSFAVASGPATI